MAPGALQADTLEGCGRITDDTARLGCYDLLARPAPAAPAGHWQLDRTGSALQGRGMVELSLPSESPIQGRFGGSERGTVHIRCQDNRTTIFVRMAGRFLSDLQGGGRVDYRIDERPAAQVDLLASPDHAALGLWSGGAAIPFIKGLIGSEQLVIRATPFNESPVEMRFATAGLEDALKPLRAACGW